MVTDLTVTVSNQCLTEVSVNIFNIVLCCYGAVEIIISYIHVCKWETRSTVLVIKDRSELTPS